VLDYLAARATAETERRTQTAPIVPGALDRGPGAAPGGGGASGAQRRRGSSKPS
jgi:hypothetical protein